MKTKCIYVNFVNSENFHGIKISNIPPITYMVNPQIEMKYILNKTNYQNNYTSATDNKLS